MLRGDLPGRSPGRLTLIGKPARSMNCRFYAIQHWLAGADRGWCRLSRDRRRCGHHRRRVHAVRCAERSDLVALLIRVRIPPRVHSSTCDAADRPCPPRTPATARKWVPLRDGLGDARPSRHVRMTGALTLSAAVADGMIRVELA